MAAGTAADQSCERLAGDGPDEVCPCVAHPRLVDIRQAQPLLQHFILRVGRGAESFLADYKQYGTESDEWVLDHGKDAAPGRSGRCARGTSHASENPCEVIPCAVLFLVASLANPMNQVSSTIAAGPSRSSRLA
jgi:hypothetical protein